MFAPSRWDTPADRERKRPGPPCRTCCPELHADNARAYALYARCAGQLIVGPMGEPIDINVLAVACVMDRQGIPLAEQDELLEQVQRLSGVVLREKAAEAERKRETDGRDRR